jgi:hypothetical protein
MPLQKNGSTIVPKSEFQSFAAYPRYHVTNLGITIPMSIRNALGLDATTLLEIAIRKLPEDMCTTLYGQLPLKSKRKTPFVYPALCDTKSYYPSLPLVQRYPCPVCQRLGRLQIRKTWASYTSKKTSAIHKSFHTQITFIHAKGDGFETRTYHNVSKRRFPKFWNDVISKNIHP